MTSSSNQKLLVILGCCLSSAILLAWLRLRLALFATLGSEVCYARTGALPHWCKIELCGTGALLACCCTASCRTLYKASQNHLQKWVLSALALPRKNERRFRMD